MDKTTQLALLEALARTAPARPVRRAERILAAALACVQLFALGGCTWLSLSWGAFSYPTTQRGEAANVAVHGDWAYVTRGTVGLEVVRVGRSARSHVFAPPAGMESVDDVAIADGLLFALDARAPGHLAVMSLADPAVPRPVGKPVKVAVGPFAGVTAAGGRVMVSGGSSPLTLRAYDINGRLGATVASAQFGEGQPDALLDAGGELGVVSTHASGAVFQLALVRTTLRPPRITRIGAMPLDTYGFTPGGAMPASFPIKAAADGTILYVASGANVDIVDVADPAAPRLVARLDPGVMPVNVDVRAGIAAVVGSEPRPRLVFVDVRNPARPRVLHSFALPEGSLPTGVALTDSYAVVAAHSYGAQLFDRSELAWEPITRPFPSLTPAGVG